MATIHGIHAYLEAHYDAESNRVAIGSCKCKPDTTVYIFNVDQPMASMTVGCLKKLHAWKDVKKADILFSLHDKKTTPPAMSRVKNTIESWKLIVPDNVEQGELGPDQQKAEVITKVVPVTRQSKGDLVGQMQALGKSASSSGVIVHNPEDAGEGPSKRGRIVEGGDKGAIGDDTEDAGEGPSKLEGFAQDADNGTGDKADGVQGTSDVITKAGVGAGYPGNPATDVVDEEFTIEDREKPAEEDNKPDQAWIIFVVDGKRAVRVTAAVLAYIGKLIIQHGIPLAVNALVLLDAWRTGNGLQFARALEPMALMLWPQHWIDDHAMTEPVFQTLKMMITTDVAYQQMGMLHKMVQQMSVPIPRGITPAGPENEDARRELETRITRRNALEKQVSLRGKSGRGRGAGGKTC